MSGDRSLPTWARLGLYVQGAGVMAWWTMLFVRPYLRSYFFADQDQRALLPFLIPDLLVYVVLGCAVAATASRKLLWLYAGGVGYATFYTWGYSVTTGAGWLSAALMSVTFVFAALLLWRIR